MEKYDFDYLAKACAEEILYITGLDTSFSLAKTSAEEFEILRWALETIRENAPAFRELLEEV